MDSDMEIWWEEVDFFYHCLCSGDIQGCFSEQSFESYMGKAG